MQLSSPSYRPISSWVPLSVPLCTHWFVCSPSAHWLLLLLKLMRPWLFRQSNIWVSVPCAGGFPGFPTEDLVCSFVILTQLKRGRLCFTGSSPLFSKMDLCSLLSRQALGFVVIKRQRESMKGCEVTANWLRKLALSGSLNSLSNKD